MHEELKPLPENEEEKELFRWISPERVFKTRSKEFYSTVMVLGVLVGIIFFFIEGVMPVLVVAAIIFVVFALSKTPPNMVEHTLSNKGVGVAGDRFSWNELVMFWFEDRHGVNVLHLLTTRTFPRQLALVLPVKSEGEVVTEERIKQELVKYLPLQKLPPSWVDKAIDWFNKKVPLGD